ncbi:MAG: NAD-dependent epimerase/dehydratase family protein [Holophagaceae bacterium]|nr:NAD-dependent epimerase/dehydratase family protein [Holophagaceae bacterium]
MVLFGARGQLGSALHSALDEGRGIRSYAWHELESILDDPHGLRSKVFEDRPCDVLFASGLTDPNEGAARLRRANVEFVQRVVAAAQGLDARFLTFGTIQEHFPNLCATNPYLDSKLELGGWMAVQAGNPRAAGRFLHLRLHTLYGGEPKPHMFIGQIVRSLRDQTVFRMSSGDQLREYHHADDVALGVRNLLQRDWSDLPGPSLDLNSGEPLRLADLARGIFTAFGAAGLLEIGALERPAQENTREVFPRSPEWLLPASREPLSGVVEQLLSRGKAERHPH